MDSTENTEAKVEPILDRGSSPKPDFILERKLDAANDDSPSTSVNIGSQIVTQTVTTPEKPVNGSSQENPRESHVAHEYSEHVLLKSNSKQYFEVPVQEISTQLVSSDDSFLGAAQEVQSGDIALERELNTAQGTELGNSHKENIFKRSSPVRSSPPIKNSPRSSSKNCTLEIRENVLSDNPVQGDTEVEVTDVMAVQPMELRALKDIKQIQGSVPKAVSPLNRQMNIGNPVSIKEKTMGTFHSPSLVNFGESEAALNLASIPKNSQPLCDGKINARHSSLPDLKSKKIEESNGKDGNPKTNILKSLKKPAMEGLHVALGNEEKDNGHLTSTSKLSPSNIGRKACDISSLKISRICDLSKFNVQKEKKPMRHRDLGSQMTDSVEKKNFALPSPSLRKKTSEESNAGSVILNPLKRVMESHSGNPNTSSKLWKVSPKSEEAKAVHRDENLHNLKSFSLDQIPSALFIPPDLYMTSLEVPSLIEANGNIEKAEACAKELEDICNMLKKKNEDAKELLARALVNNNLLLMLNHPVYEDKISFPF
ncbi:uncharacterized protein [Aristolochia californica]|uniref:uncharacterized protein n=1 Tax=Aristolochia californica TaxID=171875 RepID=UPI0035D601A4